MSKLKVKVMRPAKKGLLVPYPMSQKFLPEDGAPIEMTSYWVRRKLEGAIVEVTEPAKTTVAKKKIIEKQEKGK